MLRNSRGITPRNNILKDTFWGIAGTVSRLIFAFERRMSSRFHYTDCHADLEDALGGWRSSEGGQAAGRAQVVDYMLNVHVVSLRCYQAITRPIPTKLKFKPTAPSTSLATRRSAGLAEL